MGKYRPKAGDGAGPTRTCVACRKEAGKVDLIRLVRRSDGAVELDPTGRTPGRGAYLHPSADCIAAAHKRKALERALGAPIAPEVWTALA